MPLHTLLESGLFDTIAGLPVHPLVVHATVVLLPLAALGTIVLAFSRTLRGRFGWLVVATYAVAAVSAFVAKESGEALGHHVGEPRTHAFWGDIVPVVAIPAFLLTLVWFIVARRADKAERPSPAGTVLGIIAAVASAAAIAVTVLAGHSGAQAAWGDRLDTSTATASSSATPAATPSTAPTASAPATPSSAPSASQAAGTYTLAQVATHSTAASCWSAVNGNVYDLTKWITEHPGGSRRILDMCGKDATRAFQNEHADNQKAIETLAGFQIGTLA